jgi:hypothetical protein
MAGSSPEAHGATCLREVDHLATLGDLDLAGGHELGGGIAGRRHERPEATARDRASGVGRADRLTGLAALEQLDDRGTEAILLVRDGGMALGRHSALSLPGAAF